MLYGIVKQMFLLGALAELLERMDQHQEKLTNTVHFHVCLNFKRTTAIRLANQILLRVKIQLFRLRFGSGSQYVRSHTRDTKRIAVPNEVRYVGRADWCLRVNVMRSQPNFLAMVAY